MRPRPIALFLASFVFATLAAPLLLAVGAADARQKVTEGNRLFRSGDFEAADRAFAEADVALVENPRIAFDRGCALQALGDLDKAISFYNQAALAQDAQLAAAARYNLGTLNVDEAKTIFGANPEQAGPEQRTEGLAALNGAVRHFRECLEVQPGHTEARRNLEGIRLWIKHMTALWEEIDRQKQRDELDLLKFLELIQREQIALRAGVQELVDLPDSPKRREAVGVAEIAQRKLQEEIPFLKEKITETLQPPQGQGAGGPGGAGAAPAGPSPEEIEQGLNVLHGWADEAAGEMSAAADFLAGGAIADVSEPQWKVVEGLERIFNALAPFPAIVKKSIEIEEEIVDATVPLAERPEDRPQENADQPTGADSGDPGDFVAPRNPSDAVAAHETPAAGGASSAGADPGEVRWGDMQRLQTRVTGWAQVLPYKADEMAKQLEAMPVQQRAPGAASFGEEELSDEQKQALEKAKADREGLQQACEKAKELAPRIQELSTEAAGFLGDEDPRNALIKEEEALALLKEIAELMPKQEQQPQDQNQDGQGQDQQDQQKEQDQQEQQKNEQKRKQEVNPEELMRKVAEKERKHKEKQEELMKAFGRSDSVEKDW